MSKLEKTILFYEKHKKPIYVVIAIIAVFVIIILVPHIITDYDSFSLGFIRHATPNYRTDVIPFSDLEKQMARTLLYIAKNVLKVEPVFGSYPMGKAPIKHAMNHLHGKSPAGVLKVNYKHFGVRFSDGQYITKTRDPGYIHGYSTNRKQPPLIIIDTDGKTYKFISNSPDRYTLVGDTPGIAGFFLTDMSLASGGRAGGYTILPVDLGYTYGYIKDKYIQKINYALKSLNKKISMNGKMMINMDDGTWLQFYINISTMPTTVNFPTESLGRVKNTFGLYDPKKDPKPDIPSSCMVPYNLIFKALDGSIFGYLKKVKSWVFLQIQLPNGKSRAGPALVECGDYIASK